MAERKVRPYRMPEEGWERAFLPAPVMARVDERMLSSSLVHSDEPACDYGEMFRVSGRVQLGEGVIGACLCVGVRAVSSSLHYDLDPPFKGIGLLSYLPQEAMRSMERPGPDQLVNMDESQFFQALERARSAESQLDAEVLAESGSYERLRRIVVESALWERVDLHVSLNVVGLAHEWTRRDPLVITELNVFTRPAAQRSTPTPRDPVP